MITDNGNKFRKLKYLVNPSPNKCKTVKIPTIQIFWHRTGMSKPQLLYFYPSENTKQFSRITKTVQIMGLKMFY